MVFHSVSQAETPTIAVSKSSMATSSAKTRSLHNLPPSNLNWSRNQSNNHRFRRVPDPTHLTPTRYSEYREVSPLKNDQHRRSHQSVVPPVSRMTNKQHRSHQSMAPPVSPMTNKQHRSHQSMAPPVSRLTNDQQRSHQSMAPPVSRLTNDQHRSHQSVVPPVSRLTNDQHRSHQSVVPPVSRMKNDHMQCKKRGDSVLSSELRYASSSSVKNASRIIRFSCSTGSSSVSKEASEHKDRSGPSCEGGKSSGLSIWDKPPKKRMAALALAEWSKEKPAETDCAVVKQEGKSKKICIRIKSKSKASPSDDKDKGSRDKKPSAEVVEEPEPAPKTWNLRPRRPLTKPPKGNGGAQKTVGQPVQETKPHWQNRPELARSRGPTDAVKVPDKKKKKTTFSVALSKQEIQEDFLAMTGSKPPRRPKKRAKNVEKELEGVFPGMWLRPVTTAAAYGVPDPPLKA
ncbi:DUF1639 family protein [Quillaja saponaria]|uniref:DUF1639 family protein n=1 Tax=Quillaja saponaria TaxID=32244 RepID=A0AAD7L3Y2_QUISA|nr:DUF1639 family protein [Quillaja saponaria]